MTVSELPFLGYGNDANDLDQGMIPEMQAPLLTQAFDKTLQLTLQYLKYKKLSAFSGRNPPEPVEEFGP